MRKATLAVTAVIVILGTAVGVGVGASTTPAAVTANTSEVRVYFRRHPIDDQEAMDACFLGDFPRTRRNGDTHYDLPITMNITNKEVRRENLLTDKSERLPGSVRGYRLNPGTDFHYGELLKPTPPFYFIVPFVGNTCVHVGLENAARARTGQYLLLTGKFRWRIASGGKFLGESLWAWKIYSFGGGRIWEGTDNFINICINGSHELRSLGGRLYCYQGSRQDETITRLR